MHAIKVLGLITTFILIIPTSGLVTKGEDIWDQGGSIKYRVLSEETSYNKSTGIVITDVVNEFYMKIKYDEKINEDWMRFDVELDGASSFLIFKDNSKLDVNTHSGFGTNGDFTGLFFDTGNLDEYDQFEPLSDLKINHTYMSVQVSEEVLFGGNYNYYIQGNYGRERIPGYVLIPVSQDEYHGQYAISQKGGVLLSAWSTIEVEPNNTVTYDLNFRINLISYDHVDLSTLTNKLYNSPLAQIILTISLVGLVYYIALRYNPVGRLVKKIRKTS